MNESSITYKAKLKSCTKNSHIAIKTSDLNSYASTYPVDDLEIDSNYGESFEGNDLDNDANRSHDFNYGSYILPGTSESIKINKYGETIRIAIQASKEKITHMLPEQTK